MTILESIVYGLISGLSEFLPISSQGHQAIFLRIFGQDHRDPVRDFLVHIAIIAALLIGCKSVFLRLRREQALSKRKSRKNRTYERKSIYDLRLVKTAMIPLLVGMFLYLATRSMEFKPLVLTAFFILNGIILIIPEYMAHGNKDARVLTGWDAIVMGLCSVVASFPGISRIGAMSAFTTARGADRQNALNWILVLSLPALAMFLCFDIVNLIVQGFDPVSFSVIVGYVLSAGSAFIGGYLSIVIVRYLTVQIGYAGFAYYSWGAALFSFVLYLIV